MKHSSKYDAFIENNGIVQIENWARQGLIDKEIAEKIGINISTLTTWKITHPDVKCALLKGKDYADGMVEKSLYERACGYRYTEETTTEYPDGKIQKKKHDKHMPPDAQAGIFWLKNRKPEVWKDIRRIDAEVKKVNEFSNAALEKMIVELENELYPPKGGSKK